MRSAAHSVSELNYLNTAASGRSLSTIEATPMDLLVAALVFVLLAPGPGRCLRVKKTAGLSFRSASAALVKIPLLLATSRGAADRGTSNGLVLNGSIVYLLSLKQQQDEHLS